MTRSAESSHKVFLNAEARRREENRGISETFFSRIFSAPQRLRGESSGTIANREGGCVSRSTLELPRTLGLLRKSTYSEARLGSRTVKDELRTRPCRGKDLPQAIRASVSTGRISTLRSWGGLSW